ncbi:hypothetical protein KIH74_26440 [Kineosporia sp. J2-2]|uniref:FtsX-like permease family protein n=1 Tax=Kineosporia corallincola TaxID=2835133 RepID=A0ABS5TQQ1_9ACTN|nr:hypothetical protein [Kineosporia corallincola]MBT0772513.1 hypothetical protein [Kineosporia corallincola]
MRGGWPLLRRAPGRMLRSGSTAVMIAVSVALLAALVAAGPLFGRATASGSLERKLATVPASTQVTLQPALGVVVQGVIPARSEARLTELVDSTPWLGSPVTARWGQAWQLQEGHPTPYVGAGGLRRSAVLWYRTGAVEALDVVRGERGAKGVWLPDGVATDLGLEPGDTFRAGRTFQGGDILGCTSNGTVLDVIGTPATTRTGLTLAGTFRTGADGRMPTGSYFSAIASQIPSDPLGCPTPAILVIGDRDTIATALDEAQEVPVWTYSATLTAAGRTPGRLEQAAVAAQRAKVDAADPGSELSALFAGDDGTSIGRVETALPELQQAAEADARTAAQQGRGIAYAGGALGLAAVVVALRALARRRRRETELLLGLGTPTPVVVGAGFLELLLPALVGAAAGGAGAWLAFERFGPQRELGPGAVRATLLAAGFVALLTLICNALVTLLQARAVGRELAGLPAGRAGGPWLPLLTGATVLAVAATLSRDGDGSYTDPLSAVLPILVLACGCLLLVRLAGPITPLLARRRAARPAGSTPSRSPDRLVLRGLRNTGVAVADLVVVLAIGAGVLAYGLVSASAVHGSALDKASVLAGAASTAHIPHSYDLGGGEGPSPRLAPGLSVVWRATGQLRPDYVGVDVMVVDPDTLAAVAAWGQGPELARAKAALALFGDADGADANGAVPAVLIGLPGHETGSGATVLVGADELRLTARGSLGTFPGAGRPTVLFDARSLFPAMDARNRNLDPSVDTISGGQGNYATWLWSSGDLDELNAYLERRSVSTTSTGSLEQARATPVLTSSGWAASYQVVLGAAAAALAGLSVLVAVDRRVARAAPVDLVLRRFGVRPRRLVRLRATELALTCLGALAVLAAPLALVLVLLPRLVEPGPGLAPAMGVQVPLVPLLITALAALAVTALAVLVAARRSATLKPAEVLRDDQ